MNFEGNISASKSLFNRALILQSWIPSIQIDGFSDCDDVIEMKLALKQIQDGLLLEPKSLKIHAGNAGTTFRFLAFRLSRIPGHHIIEMGDQISRRPQTEIIQILSQLSVKAKLENQQFFISGNGWQIPNDSIQTDTSVSSQFLSGLFLNSIDLPKTLRIRSIQNEVSSELYLKMTLDLLSKCGCQIQTQKNRFSNIEWMIPSNQKLSIHQIKVEPDYSSVLAVVIAAALCGSAYIQNAEQLSLQPDHQMLSLLAEFNIFIKWESSSKLSGLKVDRANNLKAASIDIRNMPDTFPVLSVLCSFCNGTSKLQIPSSLIHKESNRLAEVQKMLDLIGVKYQIDQDYFYIEGQIDIEALKSRLIEKRILAIADPAGDHRMAMAYGILQKLGFRFKILDTKCVSKSFPEFWQVIGL